MQREKVAKPALMRSVSVGVNSRAPFRISTLFWSFMFFSFHSLGPLERAQARTNFLAAGRRMKNVFAGAACNETSTHQ